MNKDGEGSVMVKNSWGGWGDGGYIELAMSVKHNYNSCGMLNQPQGVDQV
jgi:C1A family cysteine protease